MAVYKLSDKGKQRVKKEFFRLLLFIAFPLIIIFGLIPAIVLSYKLSLSILSPSFLEPIAMLVAIMAISVIYASWTNIKSLRSLQFTVDHNRIIKEQNGKGKNEIQRSDITQFYEIQDKGFEIHSNDSTIFVPRDIDNYDELKSIIASWIPQTAEVNTMGTKKVLAFASIVCAILLAIYCLTANRILGICLSFLILVLPTYTIGKTIILFIKSKKGK